MPTLITRGAGSANGFGFAARTGGGTDGTVGIFTLGCGGGTTRNKYTYATCSSTAAGVGAATSASWRSEAAGNTTRGIFALGMTNGSTYTATRDKYTYACCAVTAATSASVVAGAGDAAVQLRLMELRLLEPAKAEPCVVGVVQVFAIQMATFDMPKAVP